MKKYYDIQFSLAVFIAFLIYCVGITIFNSFVLSCLWSWFLVPLGLPKITIVHAFGISLLISFFQKDVFTQLIAKNDEEESFTAGMTSIVFSVVIYISGLIASYFV